MERYKPEIYHWNVLELDQVSIGSFDSVAMMNLLHCLPGAMKTKEKVLEHAKELLNPGGAVFGSTLLYRGVNPGFWARYYMTLDNMAGVMSNKQDDLAGLKQNLEQVFSESSVRVVACMALFWARK